MDSKIAFLAEIFPNKSIEDLTKIVRENPNCDTNVLATIVMTSNEKPMLKEKKKMSEREKRSQFLAQVHTNRLNVSKNPPMISDIKFEKMVKKHNSGKRIQNDIHAARSRHRSKWQRTRFDNGRKPKMMTLSDLGKKNEEYYEYVPPTTQKGRINTIDNSFGEDPRRIGMDSLKYSNEFRKKNGKSVLKWSEKLHKIAMVHSKAMGDGKVPFGHKGFNGRTKDMTRATGCRGTAENVAYTSPVSNIAEFVVNGWIESPGHRKNLLSNQTLCAIACYKNSRGLWYLTQLFAKL